MQGEVRIGDEGIEWSNGKVSDGREPGGGEGRYGGRRERVQERRKERVKSDRQSGERGEEETV